MKKCSACNQIKPLENFAWKSKTKQLKQSRCKECYSDYNRAYYKAGEHKKQLERISNARKKTYAKYKEWKQDKYCQICNENADECLELHHIDPSVKDGNPSQMLPLGWKKFLEEAAKCIVLCSNCHRKVHSGRISLDSPTSVF